MSAHDTSGMVAVTATWTAAQRRLNRIWRRPRSARQLGTHVFLDGQLPIRAMLAAADVYREAAANARYWS